MSKHLFIVLINLILTSAAAFAQTGDNKVLGTEQVNVVKDYEPTIINAHRFFNDPLVQDSTPPAPKLKYETITKQYPTYFQVEPITHATIKGEPLLKLQNHFIRAGFGNYNTPLAEYAYNSSRAKKYNYAVYAKHFSSAGSIKNKLYPGISENFIKSDGKFLFKNHVLIGDVGYSREAMHYYGIADTLIADSVKLKSTDYYQWFGNIGLNAALKSTFADSQKVNYLIKANYYTYFDNYSSLETNAKIGGDIGKYNGKEWFGGYAGVDYYYNTTSLVSDANAYIVTVAPRAELQVKKLKGRIGVKTFVQSDTVKSVFNFFPDVDFKLTIVDRFVNLQGGITGNVYRNSYKKMSTENPFITPTAHIANTTEKLNTYAGLYGALGNRLNYYTLLEYKQINNLLLYQNFIANKLGNRFISTYDTGSVIKVTGELAYQATEKFKLLGRAEYYDYKLKNEKRPWQLPTLNLTLAGRYALQEKIIVGLDVFYIGNRFAKTFVPDTTTIPPSYTSKSINLKPITDVNLLFEYRYTQTLSGFIRLNNVAAARYYRWNNYPTYRFNFLLGFTYSF
ncbi:MAG: hypothetical protein IT239_05795 [Bacteroidia bacterium]|nr:hypothetical protein [Bacteroidia bacterium]